MADQTPPLSRRSDTTLPYRAATYFGYHDKPRRSIRINNTDCLIVADAPSGKHLIMFYSESWGRPRGDFIKMTDRVLHELVEALEEFYVAP